MHGCTQPGQPSLRTKIRGNACPLQPVSKAAEVFATEHRLRLSGTSIVLNHYPPAHTDSDISVTFTDADIVHVGGRLVEWRLPFRRLLGRRQHGWNDSSRGDNLAAVTNRISQHAGGYSGKRSGAQEARLVVG